MLQGFFDIRHVSGLFEHRLLRPLFLPPPLRGLTRDEGMHNAPWLRDKAIQGSKIKGLGEVFPEKGFCSLAVSSYSQPWRRACRPWLGYSGFHFVPCWAFYLLCAELVTLRIKKRIHTLKPVCGVYVKDIFFKKINVCCRVSGKPTCFACCGSLIFSMKSEGEQKEKGVMQFSIFVQPPALEYGVRTLLLCDCLRILND